MNRKSLTISVVAGSLLLAACAGQQGDKQKIGGILGAAGGAVAGAQMGNGKGRLAEVAAGTLLGALVGSSIGQSMDELDRLKAQQTTETALETLPDGRDSTWINPNSGNSGTVTPTRTYYDQESQPCREYQSVATIGGETQQVYGTACRQADGSWRVVQ